MEERYLSRSIHNTVDEVDQLLQRVHRLAGQEVLLIGRVEYDEGRHRHIAEEEDHHSMLLKLRNKRNLSPHEEKGGGTVITQTH